MCGEDEDGPSALEDHLYSTFLAHARVLFAAALTRARNDGEAAQEEDRYSRMAMQSLVFARLAGFMASHLALTDDPLRKVMEAMMHGYSEAEHMEHDHDHDHDGSFGHFGHRH
jgi:hypothetical protein